MKHFSKEHAIRCAVMSAIPRTELKRLRAIKNVDQAEKKHSKLVNAVGEAVSAVMLTAVASVTLIGFASGG